MFKCYSGIYKNKIPKWSIIQILNIKNKHLIDNKDDRWCMIDTIKDTQSNTLQETQGLIMHSPYKNVHIHPEPINRIFNSQSPATQNFASKIKVTLHGLKLPPKHTTQLSISCSSHIGLYMGPQAPISYNSDVGRGQLILLKIAFHRNIHLLLTKEHAAHGIPQKMDPSFLINPPEI